MEKDNITLTKQEFAEMLEKAVSNSIQKNVNEPINKTLSGLALFFVFFAIGALINIFSTNYDVGFSFIGISIVLLAIFG